MIRRLIRIISRPNRQIVLASFESGRLRRRDILLAFLFSNTILQFGIYRILVAEVPLIAQIPYAPIRRFRVRGVRRKRRLILKAELEPLVLDHLLGSLLNYESLLADAEVLQVLQADAELRVQVRRKLPRCIHVQPLFIMVPEDLMLLVQRWNHSIILSRLRQIRIRDLPPRLVINFLIFVQLK